MSKFEKRFDSDGLLKTVKVEDSKGPIKIEMPTEVRKPKFKPEGRILLCDLIPFGEEVTSDLPGRPGEFVAGEQKTESGIYLSATAKKDATIKAVVCAVGNLVDGYEIGDIIVYKPIPQNTYLLEVEGHKYVMMEQYNVIGKYLKD